MTRAAALVVVDTAYVPWRLDVQTHYEIRVARDQHPSSPQIVLLTDDHELYQRALVAEGTTQRFDVEYRPAKRGNGQACLKLIALERVALETEAAR